MVFTCDWQPVSWVVLSSKEQIHSSAILVFSLNQVVSRSTSVQAAWECVFCLLIFHTEKVNQSQFLRWSHLFTVITSKEEEAEHVGWIADVFTYSDHVDPFMWSLAIFLMANMLGRGCIT